MIRTASAARSRPARSRPARSRISRTFAAAGALAVALTGCGADAPGTDAPAAAGEAGYPLTIRNCGAEVTFEQRPERAVLLKSAAVPFLHELGVLSEVVTARAGAYPRDYYDDATWAELQEIPMLSDELDSSGHLQISREAVVAQRPDIVLGDAANLDRDTLAAAGLPLLQEPALCPQPPTDPSFEDIYDQMRTYGRIFDAEAEAEAAVARLQEQLADVLADVDPNEQRTAAVLYPTVGGGVPYAYGTSSMAHPQLEAAGFTNVFADVQERVFEVTPEELVGRNPDVLILLYSDGAPEDIKAAVTSLNGADAVTAVQQDAILVQPFNFTEPPGPLAIDGLARMVEHFSR